MNDNPDIHHRRSIRLTGYDYSQSGAYFVTVCTRNRECLLGKITDGEMVLNEYGRIAQQYWMEIPQHYQNVQLDEYVVMPNHVHGIVVITEPVGAIDAVGAIHVGAIHELPLRNTMSHSREQRRKMLLPKIIGRFKMNVSKQINQIRNTPGISVWQRNYYEHIIRDEKSLENIRNYIIHNPAQWEEDENNLLRKMKHANQ